MLVQKRLWPHMNLRPEVLAMREQLAENLPGNCEDNNTSHKGAGLVFREKMKYHK